MCSLGSSVLVLELDFVKNTDLKSSELKEHLGGHTGIIRKNQLLL